MIDRIEPYPNMKPSNYRWLGDIPAHWDLQRIKTLLREVDNRTKSGEERLLSLRMREGLIDHLSAGGKPIPAEALIGYKLIEPGNIVMNRMRAASGLFGIANSTGLVSPDYAVFRLIANVEALYLVHIFKLPAIATVFRAESKGLGTGESGFLRLYTERFDRIAIPQPPVDEQSAIIRFIDQVNLKFAKLVGTKKKLIKLLEEQRGAIIHRAMTRGLTPEVRFKDSGVDWMGELPQHWVVRRAKQVCTQIIDCKNRTPKFVLGGGYTVVRTTCVRNGRFNLEGAYPTDRANFEIWTQRGIPRAGDIFFTREAPAGEACLVPDKDNLCMGQRMMYLRPDPELITSEFLLYSIYGPVVRAYVEISCNGSTVSHLRLGQVGSLPLFWCPIEEQKRIVNYITAETCHIDVAIDRAKQEVNLLREYCARLTADVVTGKLDVRAAAADLPEVLEPAVAPAEALDSNEMELLDDDDIQEETMA